MDRLQEIQAILADDAKRAALSDEKIAELESELLSLFADIRSGKIEGVARNDTAKLREVDAAVRGIWGEAGTRFEAAETAAREEAEREAEADALEAALRPAPAPEPVAEAPAVETPAEPEPVVAEVPEPAVAEPVLEPVGASTAPAPVATAPQASLGDLAAAVPAGSQPAPRIENVRPRWQLVGSRDTCEFAELAERVAEANESFAGSEYHGAPQKITVGRMKAEYVPERDLSGDISQRQIEKAFASVLDRAEDPGRWTEALVASGGFCAPPAVAYDVPTISGAQRPVRDYLPGFRADRGGLTFLTPPRLSSVATSTAQVASSSVSIWTNTVDTTPGGTTKPKQTIPCPAQVTVTLQAIVEQVQIGNFLARALPEQVAAWLTLVAAAQARVAETQNLSDIDSNSTQATVTKLLGATPDLVMSVRQAAAAYRNRHRMAPDARLRVMFPAWVVDFVAADMSQRHAGDGLDIFTVDENWVRGLFTNMNVNVTFYQDSSTTAGTMVLGNQGPTDIRNWPLTVVWYLFHEGAFMLLDGGTLDLGIVRDSTLNGTNDYQIFSESWEKVAFRGIESVKFTQTTCPTGEGANDHAALTCASS